ncbi:MAG TPA: LacI family DNA-binding transcriptional regulator [Patescibacteria group bacterium]|nr:LacI family DNA-binding transcriptional regulator [Patescibacteria group bacterium]
MGDIAKVAGVSRSTVSRILTDAPISVPVAASTRARILAAAEELGYRPNPIARALRGAPTKLLGVIVRDITDPFFGEVIEAISLAAREYGYNIVLGAAHAQGSEAIGLTAVLEARQCDAIMVLGDFSDQPQPLSELQAVHVPVIALWQARPTDRIPTVNVDNTAGIEMAMRHLEGLGHRRIAFIAGRLFGDIRERQEAYSEAMRSVAGGVPAGYIQSVVNTTAGGADAMLALLDLPERPTAVVASTDVLAIGALRAALTHGVAVPDDISLVGFDDIPMAACTVPALTTVRMPITEIAEAGVRYAIGLPQQAGDSGLGLASKFSPTFIVRESTGSPRM